MSRGLGRAPLLGTYVPGTSVLHRAPAGILLAGLAVFAVVLVVLRGPWWALAGVAVALGLHVVAGVGARPALAQLRLVRWVLLVLFAYQWWARGLPVAVEVCADVLAGVLAATAVTSTTPVGEVLDAVVRAARPLRRTGVDPERLALLLALTVRNVPLLARVVTESRDAARARGLERSPRAVVVPSVVRAVGQARRTGEALAARGLGER